MKRDGLPDELEALPEPHREFHDHVLRTLRATDLVAIVPAVAQTTRAALVWKDDAGEVQTIWVTLQQGERLFLVAGGFK